MKTCRNLSLALLLFAGAASAAWAQSATCTVTPSILTATYLVNLHSTTPAGPDRNTLLVNGQAPVGTTIGKAEFTVVSKDNFTMNCTPGWVTLDWGDWANLPPDGSVPTGIPGVGMRVKINGQPPQPKRFSGSFSDADIGINAITVEFVRTGEIDWEVKPLNTILLSGRFSGSSFGLNVAMNANVLSIGRGAPTCEVTSRDISVSMGRISVNTVSKAPQIGFHIPLKCEGGVEHENLRSKVYVTLWDMNNPQNDSDILGLKNDGVTPNAQGVGIQLTNGAGAVIKYGQKNPWHAGDTGNGVFNIPIKARYIQTGPVTAGAANAKATFTLNYL